MSDKVVRALSIAAAGFLLAGCESTGLFSSNQAVTSTRVIADDREADD